MGSQKRNNELHIDKEALATLALVKEGILSPVDRLMNKNEAEEVDRTQQYKGSFFPFSFLLAPSGSLNEEVLKAAKPGDILDLIVDRELSGTLVVEEVFPIDRMERCKRIFGTTDPSHPGVKDMLKRMGHYAVSGNYEVDTSTIRRHKEQIETIKERYKAKNITAIMIAANPLHRGHERMIRLALEKSDFLILFLLKPYKQGLLSFELREETLNYFTENFLPKNRVMIVPFENTYIYAGYNNIILDAITARNFGCNKIAIGQNHAGIGMFYDKEGTKSIIDSFGDLGIEIEVTSEFVYCNVCRTLVSTKTCPHGSHHHISYNTDFILELFKAGVLPPAVLVRKEISAILLTRLFPNRFDSIIKRFSNFFPSEGLIQQMDETQFYLEIMQLHQTVSLT